jgi:hypothetical protein
LLVNLPGVEDWRTGARDEVDSMPKKLTDEEREAEERESARRSEREAARDEIVSAAVKMHYPDGDAPRWFLNIVSQCRVEAGTAANTAVHSNAAYLRAVGEVKRVTYHEAIIPAFAEAFPRLLARELKRRRA